MVDATRWLMHESVDDLPSEWVEALRQCIPGSFPHFAAQLLWQRNIRDPAQLRGFLDPNQYQPTSPYAFPEMELAVNRLLLACDRNQKVAIWGDFDADGVTATAVLWEGLGQIFQDSQLDYFIPNRLKASHGLSYDGIDQLAAWGAQLVITCDTGSTNLAEIDYACQQGIDVIVTDHHTLPAERPQVVAIINPRQLPPLHPLSTLSGVAVAYKLIEALYQIRKPVQSAPLTSLLDLVAIGLIADLVQLQGDCRYLAQKGLLQLQSQLQPGEATRPGVAELLTLCRRSGDRPSDIAFGIGPRINAVSRIHGDARFCVELLTSRDPRRSRDLALQAELANTRRRALQRDVVQQVEAQLARIDLGTTPVILLADEQWQPGILGLVAGQIAQRYDRPTILLSLDQEPAGQTNTERLARGSARSVAGLDLYELFQSQAALLNSYGGHPMAAGLTLPVDNLSLLKTALNRQVRELRGAEATAGASLEIDLTVRVADLGKSLFQELKLLEPCGMGNPIPRLLVRNCWFERTWHRKLRDRHGRKVGFVRTEFELRDDTAQTGFPGEWWDHYRDELPPGRCDAVVELDYNAYHRRYQVRLVDIRLMHPEVEAPPSQIVLDRRGQTVELTSCLPVEDCPTDWSEWHRHWQRASCSNQPLAVAYPPPVPTEPVAIWTQLVGIAKYLSRTSQAISSDRLRSQLGITPRSLELGLQALAEVGFSVTWQSQMVHISGRPEDAPPSPALLEFLDGIAEEQFRRLYFYQVSVATLQAMAPARES